MHKLIIAIIILFLSNNYSPAQVTQIIVGVDGFTCSLCAKGVEEQFKSLDFVKSVNTDLKNTTYIITVKSSPNLNLSQFSKAVKDGGFSVRDIKIEATGVISGDQISGYKLSTSNTHDISLKDVKEVLSDGDRVSLKGKVNIQNYSVSVTSLKKIDYQSE